MEFGGLAEGDGDIRIRIGALSRRNGARREKGTACEGSYSNGGNRGLRDWNSDRSGDVHDLTVGEKHEGWMSNGAASRYW